MSGLLGVSVTPTARSYPSISAGVCGTEPSALPVSVPQRPPRRGHSRLVLGADKGMALKDILVSRHVNLETCVECPCQGQSGTVTSTCARAGPTGARGYWQVASSTGQLEPASGASSLPLSLPLRAETTFGGLAVESGCDGGRTHSTGLCSRRHLSRSGMTNGRAPKVCNPFIDSSPSLPAVCRPRGRHRVRVFGQKQQEGHRLPAGHTSEAAWPKGGARPGDRGSCFQRRQSLL